MIKGLIARRLYKLFGVKGLNSRAIICRQNVVFVVSYISMALRGSHCNFSAFVIDSDKLIFVGQSENRNP
jgi:hypothetical protein